MLSLRLKREEARDNDKPHKLEETHGSRVAHDSCTCVPGSLVVIVL